MKNRKINRIINECINKALYSSRRCVNEEARTIYGYEGRPIGEKTDDGRINWYYSDGEAGGTKGGHYMSTMEFLRFNHISLYDDEY